MSHPGSMPTKEQGLQTWDAGAPSSGRSGHSSSREQGGTWEASVFLFDFAVKHTAWPCPFTRPPRSVQGLHHPPQILLYLLEVPLLTTNIQGDPPNMYQPHAAFLGPKRCRRQDPQPRGLQSWPGGRSWRQGTSRRRVSAVPHAV